MSGYGGRASTRGSVDGGSVWRSSAASVVSSSRRRNAAVLKIPAMQRRVPRNQKYQYVKPVIDTGMNMAKFVDKRKLFIYCGALCVIYVHHKHICCCT